MATDSRTWFYSTPPARPFFIEERVNTTLWKNRLANIHMICTQAENPIKMEGRWGDMPLQFEWQPGRYFILRMAQESKEVIGVLRQVLMVRPSFAYLGGDGMYCIEWHLDDDETRWKEIQGNPNYQGLRRIKKVTG
jgi:hypothetical protein